MTFQPVFAQQTKNPDSGFPNVYDLRTYGWVTSVKDQGTCGACWAFATMAAIESNWLKNGYGTFDLSEDNLINCQDYDRTPCEGGNFYMSSSMFGKHSGPVLESQDPYGDTTSFKNCPSNSFPIMPTAFSPDVRFLPNDMNTIKQAILDYGAIATSMYFDMASYNPSNYTYYYNTTGGEPHCVTVVGWDDNIAFQGLNPGAWIIKDSYGTGWANNGYFYVSYYDPTIFSETAIFPVRYSVPENNSPYIYFYDDFGWIDNTGFSGNTAYGLVHYSIGQFSPPFFPVQIKRIGTYVVEENSSFEIEFYSDFNNGTLSGLIGNIQSGTLPLAGYYTFPVDFGSDTIGDEYYIKVKYSSPTTNNPIPIEIYEANYNSNIIIETGKCWISPDGNNWTAIGANTSYQFDLCIKLYVEDAPLALFDIPDSVQINTPLDLFSESLPSGGVDLVEWYENGNLIGSFPQFQHMFSTPGNYEIKLIAYRGDNSDEIVKEIKAYDPVGIPENDILRFEVTPNPFIDHLEINFFIMESGAVSIELFDAQQRLIKSKELGLFYPGNNMTILKLPAYLRSGLYYLRINFDNHIFIKKVVKLQ